VPSRDSWHTTCQHEAGEEGNIRYALDRHFAGHKERQRKLHGLVTELAHDQRKDDEYDDEDQQIDQFSLHWRLHCRRHYDRCILDIDKQ